MLTLEEIENISFRKAGLGGYKTDDVDTFVDGVIIRVKELEIANKELEDRIEQLNGKILKYEENAESVQDAIITAEATAKKIVKNAEEKADTIVREAQEKADRTVEEADAKAEKTLLESSTKAETVLNNVLSKSSKSVDENNRIIEAQKIQIKKIQDEAVKFKENLLAAYQSHIDLINRLSGDEEFQKYQEELEKEYPTQEANSPETVQEEVQQYAKEAAEEASRLLEEKKKEQPKIKVEINTEKLAEKAKEQSEKKPEKTKQPEIKVEKPAETKIKSDKSDVSDTAEFKINIKDLKSEIQKAKEKAVEEQKVSIEEAVEIDDSEIEEEDEIFSSDTVKEELKLNIGSGKFGVLKLDDVEDDDKK